MTQVAFRLKASPVRAPATALLLPGGTVADLLHLCARLGFDPLPAVHVVADGFLLKLSRPLADIPAGVIGLRDLAANLHLPVGAELIPPLLDDEARALTRSRGLVFLPGGKVLGFDANQPVSLKELMRIENLSWPAWGTLPEAPPLAERLFELRMELPPPTADNVLEQGQGDIGTEEPDFPDASAPARIAGNLQFNLGKGLAWLGKSLHLPGLTSAAAALIAGAMKRVPHLSERVLGRQEAMLRELLRQFRAGKTEEALRRALPINKVTPRGSTVAGDSRLPTHDTTYSLRNLFGKTGPASVWLGGTEEVYRQLEMEYRRLAEEAARIGDFRRAAFIYGKLLNDFRTAANALARGGLHRDAAVLYLDRLGDSLAAAREYEAAGEFERALELYRGLGNHLAAAELLRRIGEEGASLAEYKHAALQLIQRGRGYYEAGELMLQKAGRPDLALPFFEQGWAQRPAGSYLVCASALQLLHAEESTADRLFALVAEADQFFAPDGNDTAAANFYNGLASLANRPALAAVRDELRDRALCGLAGKVRELAAQGIPAARVAANLLSVAGGWTPPQISDAQFAVQSVIKARQVSSRRGATRLKIPSRSAIVTAVSYAPASGTLFVGFTSGEVVRFHPDKLEFVTLTNEQKPILSLATDDHGHDLVVASRLGDEDVCLAHFCRPHNYCMVRSHLRAGTGSVFLAPLLSGPSSRQSEPKLALFWNDLALQFLSFPSLLPVGHWDRDQLASHPDAVLAFPACYTDSNMLGVMLLDGWGAFYYPSHAILASGQEINLGWSPGRMTENSLYPPHFSWLFKGLEGLELAGIGPEGTLEWSSLEFQQTHLVPNARRTEAAHGPFLAVSLVRPGVLVAVSRTAVYWLQPLAGKLRILDQTDLAIPDAVACYPFAAGGLLIVLGSDGTVALVPQRGF